MKGKNNVISHFVLPHHHINKENSYVGRRKKKK